MDGDRFVLATRAARPEDVLAIFQDAVRLSDLPATPGDGGGSLDLNEETPVAEWRAAMRCVWQGAAPAQKLEAWFDAHASPGEWDAVLNSRAVLRDVCELVASRARLPVIRPVPFLGGHSDAVGAFFAVRELMRRARMEVGDLTPSSPLAPYLRDNADLLWRLILLAPGRLPAATRVPPPWTYWISVAWVVLLVIALACCVLTVLGVGFGGFLGWGWAPLVSLAGAGAALSAMIAAPAYVESFVTPEVRLGNLRTFRDLSYVLVCRRRLIRASRPGRPAKLVPVATPPHAGSAPTAWSRAH